MGLYLDMHCALNFCFCNQSLDETSYFKLHGILENYVFSVLYKNYKINGE